MARRGSRGRFSAGRLLHSLGLYAYGIYLLHVVFLLLARGVLARGLDLGTEDAGYYILLFLATTFGTLLAVRALARLPLGRYIT